MNTQKTKPGRQSPSKPEPPKKAGLDKDSSDPVDEASRESFPASDAPAWSIPSKRRKR